ncbi:MAG TPA: response regulator [Gemmatimonadales bacterium]|jgi:diguanylate cyclase (GGDEF)-like protein|nr:response regulator [Gemmatimonadales bacterium]
MENPTSFHALASALEVVLATPSPDRPAAEVEESLHRLAQVVRASAAAEARRDLAAAADAVLLASGAALDLAAAQLLARLREEAGRAAPGRASTKLLVVEDDPVMAQALVSSLAQPDREIQVVGTAAEARSALRAGPVSLVVLDLLLPDSDGRNVLLELRADPRTASIPVFVETCRLGADSKAECFALGADAYFEKPLDLRAFAVAVNAHLERGEATAPPRDPGTGLPNRAALLACFIRTQAELPPRVPRAMAAIGLEHFRWVSDTYGRHDADEILRRIATRLALELREATCLARWEGADFVAFFGGRTEADAALAVKRAMATLQGADFRPDPDGPEIAITYSVGVAAVPPDASFEDATGEADRLRDLARATGQNRIVTSRTADPVPPRRVLFAEDDPTISRLVKGHLSREGFEVLHYPDGAAALAAAPTSGAVAVISDIEMPNLDGLGFLRRLREQPAFRHIPVMMLTAMGDEKHVVEAFELGADDYVLKPFSMREVTTRLRRLLRRPCVAAVGEKVGV